MKTSHLCYCLIFLILQVMLKMSEVLPLFPRNLMKLLKKYDVSCMIDLNRSFLKCLGLMHFMLDDIWLPAVHAMI